MKKVLLCINSISDHPTEDELDVLVQAEAVEKALEKLGFPHQRIFCSLNLEEVRMIIEKESPQFVFNLVETLGGKGSLIHLLPAMMESLRVPFTGSGSYSLLVTTDKLRTKKILKENGVPTPDWFIPGDIRRLDTEKQYILKPNWEDGSAGITDESIVNGASFDFQAFSGERKFSDYFLEEYIDGREFNITLLAGPKGPEVMPPAEMLYVDYPEHKPRILNYASKWDPTSFEYAKTIRTFDVEKGDRDMIALMKTISMKCWSIFGMSGYARVDFRIDKHQNPFVLEMNANPCIAPDAGFVAACFAGGIDYTSMIERIMIGIIPV